MRTPGRSTKPIQIGVLITDTASFTKATGVGVDQSGFKRNAVHAFIKAINAAGGVAGRKIDVIDDSIEAASPDLAGEFQAACATFTQDHRVDAVIYDGVTYHPGFEACLTKAGVPSLHMYKSFGADVTDLTNNPGLVAVNSPSIDRRFTSILHKAISGGYLRSGDRLGIFVEECPYVLRAYARTFVPIVTRAKIAVLRENVTCAQSGSDQGNVVSRLQSAALRFKSENIDNVMFLSAYENGHIFYFAQGAEQQQYAPQYLLYQQQGWANSGYPRRQMLRMRGFGGSPYYDVAVPPTPPPVQTAGRKACLSMARGHGITPADVTQEFVLLNGCDVVMLLRRALTLSGGQGGIRNLVPAIERVGTDFVSGIVLNGATRFGPGRHDGLELTAVSVFQPKCECFAYITRPSPIR